MFKNITINLTGPLCSCNDGKLLNWCPGQEVVKGKVQWTLILGCDGCGTKLVVSEKKLVAQFSFPKSEEQSSKKTKESSGVSTVVVKAEATTTATVENNEQKKD